MNLGPTSHIAISEKLNESLLSKDFSWQADVVYYNEGVKIWLSSPPTKSKQGTKYQFLLQNGTEAKHLFRQFVQKATQFKSVDFLYNDHEGSVEITLPKDLSVLFDEFFETLSRVENAAFLPFKHPLLHYWHFAAINVYY